MEIRILREQEITPALCLIRDVFKIDVEPQCLTQEAENFYQNVNEQIILEQVRQGKLIFWGAGEGRDLLGVLAISVSGHMTYFYVKKGYQQKGIGKALYKEAKTYVEKHLKIKKITANATKASQSALMSMGMMISGKDEKGNGVFCVPMQAPVLTEGRGNGGKKNTGLIIGAIVGGLAILFLLVLMGISVFGLLKEKVNDVLENGESYEMEIPFSDGEENDGEYDPFGGWGDESGDQSGDAQEEQNLSGIDGIDAHVEDDLPYEIKDDAYNFEDDTTTSSYVSFAVKYPTIEGLKDEKVQKKINKEIQNVAMETVDQIYTNPSEEFKEKILGTETPVLVNEVSYKVTYATDNLLCVAFQDYSYKGSESDYFQQLRTITINMKDGKVYDFKDIVDVDNDNFINAWEDGMISESGDKDVISELSEKEMKSVLKGKTIDDNYYVAYFLKEGGLEVGLSFNYAENDENNSNFGWVTAPFDWEELNTYEKTSDFWELVKSDQK